MAEITRQVGESSDDCIRYNSAFSLSDGAVTVGAASYADQWGGGMRFTNITIPQGSTIEDGTHLTLRALSNRADSPVYSRISAEDVNDAPTFAADKDAFDARWANRTTARVDWDNIPAWIEDADYNSPEIKTIIQEIVDRPGWQSGYDIVIFWEDFEDRTAHEDSRFREAQSYDYSPTYAPKLYIAYTPPVVGWTGKISGVTNPAKIMGVDVANIKSVKGVE